MFPKRYLAERLDLKDLWRIPNINKTSTPNGQDGEGFDSHWVRFVNGEEAIASVKFVCIDEQALYAAKAVLASRSVVFRNKYFGNFQRDEKSVDVIHVEEYPVEVVRYILLWCFTGKSPWTLDARQLAQVFHFCSYYDLHELIDSLVAKSKTFFKHQPNSLIFPLLHQNLYISAKEGGVTDNFTKSILRDVVLKPKYLPVINEALETFDLANITEHKFRGRNAQEHVFCFVVSWLLFCHTGDPVNGETTANIYMSEKAKCELRRLATTFEFDKMSTYFLNRVVRLTQCLCPKELEKIIEKVPALPLPLKRLKLEDAEKIRIGDMVDHRDNVGRFLPTTLIECDEQIGIWKLHYTGWSDKFDVTIQYRDDLDSLAHVGTMSKLLSDKLDGLKRNDVVVVNAPDIGWVEAEIRKFHVNKRTKEKVSGQVQVAYKHPGHKNKRLFWFHIDNEDEFVLLERSNEENNF